MSKRVLILFPVLLFVLIRQIYTNLTGINRDLLTAALISSLAVFALVSFELRIRRVRHDFLILDVLNLVQFHLAGVAVYLYFIAGRIGSNQAIAAGYYNCIAPFLMYSGFLLRQFSSLTKRAALVALGCAYLVTSCVAICESLGIEFWLFQYDRWLLQKNYLGIARASGLYGTQIDYGFLSFLAFTIAFYCNARRRHWFTVLVMVCAAVGVLLSMSRIWLAALLVIVFAHAVRAQSLKNKLKAGLIIVIMGALLYGVADRVGLIGMLQATDEITQGSNEGHWAYYRDAPRWLSQYMFVGTGPGTQNGPDDVRDVKFITDFLWLGTLVEFGAFPGIVLVLCRLTTILVILSRSYRARSEDPLRAITIALCITFVAASFFDSAYAHLVSIAAFYITCGLFLESLPPHRVVTRADYRPQVQPA